MSNTKSIFAKALRRETPDVLRQWRGTDALDQDIDDVLEVELGRCEDMEFATRFAKACPVASCEPKDYLQRIVEVDADQRLLTGIRFHYFLEFPFVDIIAASEPLDDVETMAQAIEAVRAEYMRFDPAAVRLLRVAARPLALPSGVTATPDQHVVVGRIGELASRPPFPGQEQVALEPVSDVAEAAAFVESAYTQFFSENPDFETMMYPAEQESLARARETGSACYLRIDGTRAGLLATRDKLGPLVRGQSVSEEVLCADYRGRGLAPLAQRVFVEHLAERHPNGLIWGTIDHRNKASRATARRVGRREVAAWHWLRWK